MTALVLGSFDVLHYGHIQFLSQAARLGDVTVGLGSDEYQRSYKHDPYLTWDERAQALYALGYDVIERSQVSIVPLLDELDPDYLVAGADWIGQPFLELSGVTAGDLSERNIGLVFLPRSHSMSTSEIVKRINES